MNITKRFLILPVVALLTAVQASALVLSVGGAGYVGSIDDGIPSSQPNEVLWVNALINMNVGATTTVGDETLSRVGSPAGLTPAFLPDPATFADKLENVSLASISVVGFEYVLGKYGAGAGAQISHVWYVGNINENVELPQQALSHVTRFNAEGGDIPGVPDGGSTIALLGLGLTIVAFLRRKLA